MKHATEFNAFITPPFNWSFQKDGMSWQVACLIRKEDWRPLQAPWWRGKEAYLIGSDTDGNFILRHCDGSVRRWQHSTQQDEVLAPSVQAFLHHLS